MNSSIPAQHVENQTEEAALTPPRKSFVVYDRNGKKSKAIKIPKELWGDKLRAEIYVQEFRKDWKIRNKMAVDIAPPARNVSDSKPPATTPSAGLFWKTNVKLDLSKKTGTTMVCYGSSKRGKSTLMIHLWKKYFNCKDIISTLFSGNPHIKCYREAGTKLLTAYGFSDLHAKYIMMQHYINCKTRNQYQFINLFDDIIDQKRSVIINKLVLTYRNANISMFICLQYIYLLSKQNRANVNHTFIFGMNSLEDIKGVLEICLGSYLTELGIIGIDNQISFFRQATTDHGFFHLDNITGKLTIHRLTI